PRPHVDDGVEDRAAGAAHELRLLTRRRLEVEPAYRPQAIVVGDAALGDRSVETARGEFLAAEGGGKEPAVVREALRLQHPGSGKAGLAEDHGRTRTSGMA